ncbi:hypothetical protein ACIGT4_23875 [Streptomyces sioyaensis]|uniref:hypothetical protein n=1 Tax=Streptomyces sioyaensis TaxID=67364 RepID=UPI0037D5B05D
MTSRPGGRPTSGPRTLLTGAGLHGNSAPAVAAGYFARHKLPQRHSPGRISADLSTGTTVEVSFDDAGRIDAVEVDTLGGAAPHRPRDRHPRHPEATAEPDDRNQRPHATHLSAAPQVR